jgi:hypothetical protein
VICSLRLPLPPLCKRPSTPTPLCLLPQLRVHRTVKFRSKSRRLASTEVPFIEP